MFVSLAPQHGSEQAGCLLQQGACHPLEEDDDCQCKEERVVEQHEPETAQPPETAKSTK